MLTCAQQAAVLLYVGMMIKDQLLGGTGDGGSGTAGGSPPNQEKDPLLADYGGTAEVAPADPKQNFKDPQRWGLPQSEGNRFIRNSDL